MHIKKLLFIFFIFSLFIITGCNKAETGIEIDLNHTLDNNVITLSAESNMIDGTVVMFRIFRGNDIIDTCYETVLNGKATTSFNLENCDVGYIQCYYIVSPLYENEKRQPSKVYNAYGHIFQKLTGDLIINKPGINLAYKSIELPYPNIGDVNEKHFEMLTKKTFVKSIVYSEDYSEVEVYIKDIFYYLEDYEHKTYFKETISDILFTLREGQYIGENQVIDIKFFNSNNDMIANQKKDGNLEIPGLQYDTIYTNNDIQDIVKNPKDFIGEQISLTAKVDSKEYRNNDCNLKVSIVGSDGYSYTNMISYFDGIINIDINDDDYIRVTGTVVDTYVVDTSDDVILHSKPKTYPQIEADSIEVISKKEALYKAIKKVIVNKSHNIDGYILCVDYIEFAQNETRIYVTIKNTGDEKLIFDTVNCMVKQNDVVMPTTYNNDMRYEEPSYSISPGEESSGCLLFKQADIDLGKATLTAYTSFIKNEKTLDPFVINLTWD